MSEEPLPLLPGFQETAQRRREVLAELAARRRRAAVYTGALRRSLGDRLELRLRKG